MKWLLPCVNIKYFFHAIITGTSFYINTPSPIDTDSPRSLQFYPASSPIADVHLENKFSKS